MPTLYNGKKITPSPFMQLSKEYIRAGGKIIGVRYPITLHNTFVGYMGSPDSDGDFTTVSDLPDEDIGQTSRLEAILRKQEAIRGIFREEGKTLEVYSWDGTQNIFKCNPRVLNIEFNENIWTEICDYTVTLEADRIYGLGYPDGEDYDNNGGALKIGGVEYFIEDASEDWQIEFADTPVVAGAVSSVIGTSDVSPSYRITHTLSATGKRAYAPDGSLEGGKQAWEQAKAYVTAVLATGIDLTKFSQVSLTGYSSYNRGVSESINEVTGTYAVTETVIVAKQNYIEEFSINTRTSTEDGRTSTTIEGTITGLGDTLHGSSSKYLAAATAYTSIAAALYSRCVNYTGVTLNAIAAGSQVGRNPVTGVITYSFDFDSRPSNCISGALSETISVSEDYQADVFATIPVLGRSAGSVLQGMSTVTDRKRTLSIEVKITPVDSCLAAALNGRPDVSALITAFTPSATQVFISSDSDSYNWKLGSYSRTISWVYQ